MRFSYSSGQRPLDGYTIKRGIGKGGFGEVYYALSDGGKEVALKLVRDDTQVELRGVAQCLNLKHPNLVALFDLRTGGNGDHWVVMEYVAGEPLSAVIQRHPNGVPRDLAREWFLGIARATAYLHDHGIVHRDLKPGNVFIENGTVKIGDYGLSKSLGATQRNAQTQAVGTVHYMAPEISTGNYNKQVDVYAAGIILYELVTGTVPFEGESTGEILMKHLTSPPDLAKVPSEWKPLIARALSKNPAHRYPGMSEMARDVEAIGQGDVVMSRVLPRKQEVLDAVPVERPRDRQPRPRNDERGPIATPAVTFRQQAAELGWSLVLSAVFAALGTALWGVVNRPESLDAKTVTPLASLFFITVAACWAVLIPGKFWTERKGDPWTRRFWMLALGGLVGLFACFADGWTVGQTWRLEHVVSTGASLFPRGIAIEASYLCYFALAFFVLRWWRMTSRRRGSRFSFAPLLGAGFWSAVLLLLIRPPHLAGTASAVVALVMTAVIVQLVSPWEEPQAAPAVKHRLRNA